MADQKSRHFLFGGKFTILMDHKPLLRIVKKLLQGISSKRLQKLRQVLSDYTYEARHVPGKDYQIVDALSRIPTFEKAEEDTMTDEDQTPFSQKIN